MKKNVIFWKWTQNEKQEKSKIKKKLQVDNNSNNGNNGNETQSLDENIYDLSNFNNNEDGSKFPVEYKREVNSERLSKRQYVIQNSINPFLLKNNYIDDINNQDKYLRGKTHDLPINDID